MKGLEFIRTHSPKLVPKLLLYYCTLMKLWCCAIPRSASHLIILFSFYPLILKESKILVFPRSWRCLLA